MQNGEAPSGLPSGRGGRGGLRPKGGAGAAGGGRGEGVPELGTGCQDRHPQVSEFFFFCHRIFFMYLI